ncbi:10693_t:CDS:10, partial [Paraglomus brasilianum]
MLAPLDVERGREEGKIFCLQLIDLKFDWAESRKMSTDQTAARQDNNVNSKQEEAKDIEGITLNIPKYVRQKETVLGKKQLKSIKDKKVKGTLQRIESKYADAAEKAARTEMLLTEEPGYLEAEGMEKTYNFTQDQLISAVDEEVSKKRFDISLPTFGPYAFDYTRNGRHMAIAGRKGHIATYNWPSDKKMCEFQVKENIRDIKWLHNELYFAVAQKKYVYIYDHNGLELHCLKKHIEVNKIEFLPYHFLLVTVGNAGWLKYQDTSTGKLVCEHRTKLGKCDAMTQNPWNAIIHLGHVNGTVTLWSPNMTTPLVKMLTHKGPVKALAVDHSGKYMATSGLDGQLKIWDIRTYKSLHEYYTPTPAACLSISQLGLLGVGWGPHVWVWKDAFTTKQQSPYMTHIERGTQIHDMHFCPYDDILGVGYSSGISSLVVPGAGEPNFDSLEANPYQTKKQRQESEVHALLEKIQPEAITLDTTFVGKIDRASKAVIEKERKQEQEENKKNSKPAKEKKKMRGRNTALKRYLRKKQKNVIDDKRLSIEKELARQRELRQKRSLGEIEKPPTALDRFEKK